MGLIPNHLCKNKKLVQVRNNTRQASSALKKSQVTCVLGDVTKCGISRMNSEEYLQLRYSKMEE